MGSYSNRFWELMSALRALIKNLIKENFYGKRKKKINILIAFFISHKSDIKTFFNWIFKTLVSITNKFLIRVFLLSKKYNNNRSVFFPLNLK